MEVAEAGFCMLATVFRSSVRWVKEVWEIGGKETEEWPGKSVTPRP